MTTVRTEDLAGTIDRRAARAAGIVDRELAALIGEFGTIPDPDTVRELITEALAPWSRRLAEQTARSISRQLGAPIGATATNVAARTARLVDGIVEEFASVLARQLGEAFVGLDPDTLRTASAVEALQQVDAKKRVRGLYGDMLNSVAQVSTDLAVRATGASGTKRWQTMDDDRVRDAHLPLHGATVGLDEAFDMAGYPAAAPGDPGLPIGLRIGCRCHLEFEVDLAETALTAAAAGSPQMSGAMLCLIPDQAVEIGILDGEPVDRLHLTLAYLTPDWQALSSEQVQELIDGLFEIAGTWPTLQHNTDGRMPVPLPAELHSVAYPFGADDAAVWLTQGPGLTALHDLTHELADRVLGPGGPWAKFPTFFPHVTAAYSPTPEQLEQIHALIGTGITFSGIELRMGGVSITAPFLRPDNRPEVAPMPTLTLDVPDDFDRDALARYILGRTGDPPIVLAETTDGTTEVTTTGLLSATADGKTLPDIVVPMTFTLGEDGSITRTDDGALVGKVDDALRRRLAGGSSLEGLSVEVDDPLLRQIGERFLIEETDDGLARWEGILVVEGSPTGDGRFIEPGALTHRDLPLPLMGMDRNPEGGAGHDGAELIGSIEWIERRGSEIWGGGRIDLGSDEGRKFYRLLQEGWIRGISVDLDSVVAVFVEATEQVRMQRARIMGATVTPFPAFAEAGVTDVDGPDPDALAASAGRPIWTDLGIVQVEDGRVALVAASGPAPVDPPEAWFQRPEFTDDELCRAVRVTPEGRIYGYAAEWKGCHIGFSNRCVRPPKSRTGYRQFRTGHVITSEGAEVLTGPLVMDTVHPDLRAVASDAMAHYADTSCAVADVVMGEDRHGIWFSGALRPDVDDYQVRALRGSEVSPDWRRVDGALEAVALLVVNVSGYPVAGLAASGGIATDDNGDVLTFVPASAPAGEAEAADELGEVKELVARLSDELAALRPTAEELRLERAQAALEELATVGA
ncbi:MAG: hypothetical protein AAFZ07_16510 [Actinomycetota bacterium]